MPVHVNDVVTISHQCLSITPARVAGVISALLLLVCATTSVAGEQHIGGAGCVRPIGSLKRAKAEASVQSTREYLVTAGAFRLRIRDSDGFFSSTERWGTITLGERRREVLEEVFVDMTATFGLYRFNESMSDTVLCRIDIEGRRLVDEEAAGWAEPVFVASDHERDAMVDVAPLQILRRRLLPSERLLARDAPHGYIVVNTAKPFGVELDGCPSNAIDLYSVILHELVHVLGVASIAGLECRDVGTRHRVPYASRWDGLLQVRRQEPFLARACGGLEVDLRSLTTGASRVQLVDSAAAGQWFELVANDERTRCAVDLSHLHSSSSEKSLMSTSISFGETKRQLYRLDVLALRALGYQVMQGYGMFGTRRNVRLDIRSPLTRGAVASMRDVRANTDGTGRYRLPIRALNFDTTGPLVVVCADVIDVRSQHSIAIDDSSVVVSSSAVAGARVTMRITVRDSAGRISAVTCVVQLGDRLRYHIADLTCPPNTICNGGFEVASRSGQIFVDSFDCGLPTNVANWRCAAGSADLWRVEASDTLDRDPYSVFPLPITPLVRDRLPYPRGFEFDPGNRSYVGTLTSGETGGKIDYHEGIKQRVYLTAGVRSRVALWSYVYSPHEYTRNAGLLVRIADSALCEVRDCNARGGTIVDTVLVLPTVNTWVPLWTSLFSVPKDGWYEVDISSTNCFDADPQYGQGALSGICFDDVELTAANTTIDLHAYPLEPCQGDTITAVATVTNLEDRDATLRWNLLSDISGQQALRGLSGSISVPARSTAEVPLLRLPVQAGIASQRNLVIAFHDPKATPMRADTHVVAVRVGSGSLTTRVSTVHERDDVVEMRLDVVNSRDAITPVQGVLMVKHPTHDSVIVQLPLASGLAFSEPLRSADVTMWKIRGALSAGSTSAPFTVEFAGAESTHNVQGPGPSAMVAIQLRAAGAACETASMASIGSLSPAERRAMSVSVSPNPSTDIIRVEWGLGLGAIRQLRVYDIRGTLRFVRDDIPAFSTGEILQIDSRQTDWLHTGVYVVTVTGEFGSASATFIVIR